jgi:hypothetical protein
MSISKQIKKWCEGLSFILHPLAFSLRLPRRRGQAMTEVVLLFPVFMLIVFMTAKMFALLVLVQKLEVASYYAARRWQLESHLDAEFAAGWDTSFLQRDIEDKVKGYLGFDTPAVRNFLNLRTFQLDIVRTQVWNVVTLTVGTSPPRSKLLCRYPKQTICGRPYGAACIIGYEYICAGGKRLEVVKYVPNRDRPIQFVLPGLK